MPGGPRTFDDDFGVTSGGQLRGQSDADASVPLPINEKETTKENNVAKIKVVVCCSVCLCLSAYVMCQRQL